MRIGVIIPTRGDRYKFLNKSLKMLWSQTIKPDCIQLMCYDPESNEKDISQRYKRGYDKLRERNIDVIFLWEDDDFYSPTYIESQLTAWVSAGKPDLFGLRSTIYYHIRERGFYTMYHEQMSTAMCTLIKPDLTFDWPVDSEPYLDSWLFNRTGLQYKLWQPESPICIGIKHGVGLTGGGSHVDGLERFTQPPMGTPDPEMKWISEHVDSESLEFYKNYFVDQE